MVLAKRFESVAKAKGSRDVLEIYFSSPAKNGRQYTTIHIPVPPGREAEGASVLKALEREVG